LNGAKRLGPTAVWIGRRKNLENMWVRTHAWWGDHDLSKRQAKSAVAILLAKPQHNILCLIGLLAWVAAASASRVAGRNTCLSREHRYGAYGQEPIH